MALHMTPDKITGWINELVQKNRALEEKVKRNCVLEEEVKALTLKNMELTQKLEMYERNENIGVEGHNEEVNPPMTKLEEELKCLKLDNLELTVKFQMKKMWEFVLQELEKGKSSPTKEERKVGTHVSSDHQIPLPASNPLQIERVARILMSYVEAEDLVNCRQVSKLWNQEVKHHMEQKLTFHIYESQIKTFLGHAKQSFPTFRNLKLELGSFFWPSKKKDVIDLFNKHGKSLHTLQLHFKGSGFEHNWNLYEFRDIFLNSLAEIRVLQIGMSCRLVHEYRLYYSPHVIKILPNLRILSLGLNCTNCDLVHLSYPGKTEVFTDLLRLLPNLETLHWRSRLGDDSRHLMESFESLILVNPPKFQNVFLHSEVDLGFAALIAYSELNLKELYLVEFQSFGLHLVSSPGQSHVTPKLPVYSHGHENYTCEELQVLLQDALFKCGETSCTKLLQVFISALDNIFNH